MTSTVRMTKYRCTNGVHYVYHTSGPQDTLGEEPKGLHPLGVPDCCYSEVKSSSLKCCAVLCCPLAALDLPR